MQDKERRMFDGFPGFYPTVDTPNQTASAAQLRPWLSTVINFFQLFHGEASYLDGKGHNVAGFKSRRCYYLDLERSIDAILMASNEHSNVLWELGLIMDPDLKRSRLERFIFDPTRSSQCVSVLVTAGQDLKARKIVERYCPTPLDGAVQLGAKIVQNVNDWASPSPSLTIWEKIRLVEISAESLNLRMGSSRAYFHYRVVLSVRLAEMWKEGGAFRSVCWRAAAIEMSQTAGRLRDERNAKRKDKGLQPLPDTLHLSIPGRGGWTAAWKGAVQASADVLNTAPALMVSIMSESGLRHFEAQRDLLKRLGCLTDPKHYTGMTSKDAMKTIRRHSPFLWLTCNHSLFHPAVEYLRQRESACLGSQDIELPITPEDFRQHRQSLTVWSRLNPVARASRLVGDRDADPRLRETIVAIHATLQTWSLEVDDAVQLLQTSQSRSSSSTFVANTVTHVTKAFKHRFFFRSIIGSILHALESSQGTDEVACLLAVSQAYDLSSLSRLMVVSAQSLDVNVIKLSKLYQALENNAEESLTFVVRQLKRASDIIEDDEEQNSASTFDRHLVAQLQKFVLAWDKIDTVHRFSGLCIAYRLQSLCDTKNGRVQKSIAKPLTSRKMHIYRIAAGL